MLVTPLPVTIDKMTSLQDELVSMSVTERFRGAHIQMKVGNAFNRRLNLLLQAMCYLRSYSFTSASVMRYKAKRAKRDTDGAEMIVQSDKLKRRTQVLANRLIIALTQIETQVLNAMPIAVQEGTSSAKTTTTVAMINRLVTELDSGKSDFITMLAREIRSIVNDNFNEVIKGMTDQSLVETNHDKVVEWANSITTSITLVPDYVASMNKPHSPSELEFRLLKMVLPTVESVETIPNIDSKYFVCGDLIHYVENNNIKILN